MIHGIYIGCTDPYGDNAPETIFPEKIEPILAKYNISEEDMKEIISGIRDMCEEAYSNGMDEEAFSNSESN